MTLSPMPLRLTARISRPRVRARATIGRSSRSRKPACSSTAANDRAPSTSHTVVSRLAIPPRENNSSMTSFPVLLTNPVAMAPNTALMPVATAPREGSSTNARTASAWVNGARTPANTAEPRIARNGGNFQIEAATRKTSGSRLTGVIQNSAPRASRAAFVLTPPLGSAIRPSTKKMHQADPDGRARRPEHVPHVLVRPSARHRPASGPGWWSPTAGSSCPRSRRRR